MSRYKIGQKVLVKDCGSSKWDPEGIMKRTYCGKVVTIGDVLDDGRCHIIEDNRRKKYPLSGVATHCFFSEEDFIEINDFCIYQNSVIKEW